MGRHALRLAGAFLVHSMILVVLAQEGPPERGIDLSLRIDNDVVHGRDDYYSSGFSLHLLTRPDLEAGSFSDSIARALGLQWPDSDLVVGLGLQQGLFTPQDIRRADPDPDDAPYAGLLYAAITFSGFDSRHLQAWSLYAGMIGPATGGKWLQREGHHLTEAAEPKGWDHQIGNELVLAVAHERRWRPVAWGGPAAWGGDVVTAGSLSVGNLITAGRVAGGLRIGYAVPDDFRMPSLLLGDASIGKRAASPRSSRHSAYAFGVVDVHLLGYLAPWDGRITTGGPAVDYDPWLLSGHLGIHLARDRWDLSVSGILTTVPYANPSDRVLDGYGRIDLGIRF